MTLKGSSKCAYFMFLFHTLWQQTTAHSLKGVEISYKNLKDWACEQNVIYLNHISYFIVWSALPLQFIDIFKGKKIVMHLKYYTEYIREKLINMADTILFLCAKKNQTHKTFKCFFSPGCLQSNIQARYILECTYLISHRVKAWAGICYF